MEKVTIIIATHKKYQMPSDKCYLPLHVGAEGKKDKDGNPLDLGYVKDNTGDNISSKNASFCELTGLYWAWKNLDADYIGLVHYRRHLSLHKKSKDPFQNILTDNEAIALTEQYEVIVPSKRNYWIETLYSHYKHTHFASQLDETRKIIAEQCPDYQPDYDKVIHKTWGYMFNMMIMRRDLLNDYCSWLFNILFELERRVNAGQVQDSQNLSPFQGRFYGRISEIIFNVWLQHQIRIGNVKHIKQIKCITLGKIAWRKKLISFLEAKFLGKKYEGSF
ncbi:Capsular biosynthesis protein [Lactobacillus delbrueckii subsp. delbrueckii]|uniref:Capsular biosynthesis protein n=1 Tax=Lactobacillus delbrueckii subsp. delbrueckii TaxID=83684 RepID=A0AAU9R2U0_9LACO|nr:Capsular biosynthesis protein [Lactobacillus delbrueckii subsp. delbrueckii]